MNQPNQTATVSKNFSYQNFAKIVDPERVSLNSVKEWRITVCIFVVRHLYCWNQIKIH